MGSYDNLYEKDKIKKKPGDPNKRDFTYFVLGGARFIYASAARLVALKVSPADGSVWGAVGRPVRPVVLNELGRTGGPTGLDLGHVSHYK